MILVDDLRTYPTDLPCKRWCHMVSDTSEEELHAFAASIGCRREWAQLPPASRVPHYDLTPPRRAMAIKLGAVRVTSRELVLRAYGRRQRA